MKADRTGRAWVVAGLTTIAVLGLVLGPIGLAAHSPLAARSAGEGLPSRVSPAYSIAPPGAGGLSVLSTVGIAFNHTVLGNVSYLTVNKPNAVVFDPANGLLYASGATPFIAALSGTDYHVEQVLPSGSGTPPGGLVFSPTSQDVYAANPGSASVTVVDTSNAVVANLTVGSDPVALAYSPSSKEMYVANSGSNSITVIGPTNAVVTTVEVGSNPAALQYDPADSDIYVANHGSANVSILSPANV
ncbi:MAG: hypothetical protein L3K03_01780, partial [Thermoplasmata archaeon]|nr:hypothetical protein [Thermoplasmata archaeon]